MRLCGLGVLLLLSVPCESLLCPVKPFGKRRKSLSMPSLLPAIAMPVGVFYGVMCAPLYGKGLPGAGGMVNFATLEARSSPNEYLVAPRDSCPSFDGSKPLDDGKPRREDAPVYPLSVDELQRAFEAMLRKRYSIEQFAEPTIVDKPKRQYVYVERTELLRFPDIINVQFLPVDQADNRSTMILHSASVYGYSDLGKNKQRLTDMLQSLTNLPGYITRRTVPV